tara:strand:+ start:204 stop:1010 length:807 start_codon:yes stop_codon:yes gene_type:complete
MAMSQKSNSAGAIIERIIKQTGAAEVSNTVDVIKEGDPNTQVKGIVTCMFATMEVLKKAVKTNCNLIIVHEPLYYNHRDNTEQFQNDAVFLAKKKYINDNNLVIWRFHDYSHQIKPDAIIAGQIEKFGWEKYMDAANYGEFIFPKRTLTELLKDLKGSFPKSTFQVVGDPNMKLTNVAFVPGATGSSAHISKLRKKEIDVVIAGEVPEWETYEYTRDAVSQGKNKAAIFIGHINSEESGMKYCASWLEGFIKDIPISFVACGASFWTY